MLIRPCFHFPYEKARRSFCLGKRTRTQIFPSDDVCTLPPSSRHVFLLGASIASILASGRGWASQLLALSTPPTKRGSLCVGLFIRSKQMKHS